MSRPYANQIIISGKKYAAEAFCGREQPDFADASAFHAELYAFLREWFNNNPTLTVLTSGSTDSNGAPKVMQAKKEHMWASAAMTCSTLDLHCGHSALLCLPLSYIAGKMLVVRALFAGLDLWPVTPCSNPLAALNANTAYGHAAPDFAALTPMQVYTALETPQETELLKKISRIIIGGGAVDERLRQRLRDFPNTVYSSYGMTETLSHIALCCLTENNVRSEYPWYKAFAGVRLSLSRQDTLVIDAPAVAEATIVTRDLAEIAPDGSFRILGRMDNIINSGGLKVRIEELEAALAPVLPVPFAISSAPDERLGEVIVLLLEGEENKLIDNCLDAVHKLIEDKKIPSFQTPRRIVLTKKIPLTETGKPARGKIKALADNSSLFDKREVSHVVKRKG
jgi:O-succinylbenzoic acid--CoA ligase